MKIRSYKTEILEILKSNNGCFTGFNKLLLKGDFHTTTLVRCLKEMKKENLITITHTDSRNQRQYCMVQIDFEENFGRLTRDLKLIEDELKAKDLPWDEKMLVIGNYVRLAFRKIKELNVARLHAEYVSFDKNRLDNIEKAKERISNMIKEKITMLPIDDRQRIINSLFYDLPDLLTLYEYRGIKANSSS
ncbi:MAG TPA: hypothetical protein VGR54_07120 [Nitrosopumilaceae archaeon]|nr:hypothetical protein [Nitrosopumilaceae archaeon]